MSTIEETLEPKDTDAAPIEPEHEGGDAETPAATDWVKGPSKSPKSASVSGCVQMTAEETQTPDGRWMPVWLGGSNLLQWLRIPLR
ncbi:uncharacterized protein V6R79_018905 [Siganus canaliculatus]